MIKEVKPRRSVRRVLSVESTSDTGLSLSEARFRELHSQRDRLFRAVALAVGNAALAAEAIDEAMTRAYSRWDRLKDYDSPEGWVYRVALNFSRSALRKRHREDLWAQPPDRAVEDSLPDPQLRAAIGGLSVKYRSVVVARYLLDWSTSETAEALGVPEATVKTRLRRALARLAKDLEGAEQ